MLVAEGWVSKVVMIGLGLRLDEEPLAYWIIAVTMPTIAVNRVAMAGTVMDGFLHHGW
jgi:hypothetical protein